MFSSAIVYKRWLRLGLVCLAIAFALSTVGCRQLEEAFPFFERIMERFRDSAGDPAPPEELTMTLYFADNQAADAMVGGQYGFVTPVARAMPPAGDPLFAAIEELIVGPLPADGKVGRTVPETAVLLGITVSQGTAVLNFNQEFAMQHPGGVLGTQITVESLVYTATEFSEVDAVQVLVEGLPWSDGYGFVWNAPIDRAGIGAALQTGEESAVTPGLPSGWEVYQNNNYGFVLKHPSNWSVYEYKWVDLETGEIKSESIFIAPHDMIEPLAGMANEDGSIPTTLSNIPVVINRYPEIKVYESDEFITVLSEAITIDGRAGILYTLVFLTAAPHVEAGSVSRAVVLPTDYGSLSLYLQVEQYEDIFEQMRLSFKFI